MRRLILLSGDILDTLLIEILARLSGACMSLVSKALLRCDARAIERAITERS